MPAVVTPALAALIAFVVLSSAAPAGEAEPAAGSSGAGGGAGACLRAATIPAGDGLTLAEPVAGSRQIRLAGILAPGPEPVAGDAPAFAEEARRALAAAVDGRCLVLTPRGPPRDRYGRLVAGVSREDDGILVQDELVRRGLARVFPGLGDGAVAIPSLLAGEDAARRGRRGIWADAGYRVRTPETLAAADVGSYHLVEGRVVQAMRVGPRLYLNFGEDWQTDFTVVIAARALPRFASAGLDPAALAGRMIRVRGLIEELNGPMITLDEPAALELADPG